MEVFAFVALFLLFLPKHPKGLNGKDILGHGAMMWTSLEILPLKYLFGEHKELQQCLGRSGLEY